MCLESLSNNNTVFVTEIASLVQSDSETNSGGQKQTVVNKQVVKKRARDESKWVRNIAKKESSRKVLRRR